MIREPQRSCAPKSITQPAIRKLYFFDISKCQPNYAGQQCINVAHLQHPKVHDCSLLCDSSKRYLEFYITKKNDENDVMNRGIFFEALNLTVLPCLFTTDSTKVIHLELSYLPMFTKDMLFAGLQETLIHYGEILDLGMYTEKETGLFMGTSYAVLNQPYKITPHQRYASLSHRISWRESITEFFDVTWHCMSA
ncbi:MAG: hypothetical protein EXX96DRAFT_486979 [Benjaminiella poitrasii]|nr:MAG: hypothetical protein EXX96DRAFT_486979 [Benjaminiella poitrasii]